MTRKDMYSPEIPRKMKSGKSILMVALCGLIVGTIFATNWVKVEMKCPICKTTNEFSFLQSWGSYVTAGSLAQLQYINWLEVTSSSLYG